MFRKGALAAAAGGRSRRPDPWRLMLTAWAALTLCVAGLWFVRTREARYDGDGPPSWLPGYAVEVPAYVTADFLPVNEYSRPGRYLTAVGGVVIHYVGNPGSTAQANRDYFASLSNGRDGVYASSHFVVGLDGEVVQCIPLTEIAYASNHRNNDTIAIEVCHPDDTGQFSDTTYARTVELTAWLCDAFGLDPETEVIRHYDVTGKECPRYYVRNPAAWDAFRADVSGALAAEQ